MGRPKKNSVPRAEEPKGSIALMDEPAEEKPRAPTVDEAIDLLYAVCSENVPLIDFGHGFMSLNYASMDSYNQRVSADVEALRAFCPILSMHVDHQHNGRQHMKIVFAV